MRRHILISLLLLAFGPVDADAKFCPALAQIVKARLDARGINLSLAPGEKLSPARIAEIRMTLERVDAALPDAIGRPENLTFRVRRHSDEASYDAWTRTVTVPYQFLGEGKQASRLFYTEAILAHEYGHAVFSSNLRKRFPELFAPFQKQGRAYVKNLQLTAKIEAEMDQVLKAVQIAESQSPAAQAEVIRLTSSYGELNRKVIRLKNELKVLGPPLQELKNAVSPYSEFFADLLTVHTFKNPEAIRNGLERVERSARGTPAFQGRDFKIMHDVQGWEYGEPHILLAPVRSHVWKKYLSRKPYAGTPQVLTHVFNAIISELKLNTIRGVAQIPVDEPQVLRKMNADLIRAIDQEMKSFRP